jgi:CBS domain-containing protein
MTAATKSAGSRPTSPHGLTTSPSFRKVTLDASVRLISAQQAAKASLAPTTAQDEETDIHVGLTVGNLPSALGGLASVPPTSTFEQAITIMLLNDYSQLAVLASSHILRGAVTWKSVAQARHASPSATFADAIVRAHEVRYDQELVDVLPILEAADFVFVRNEENKVAGILTTADVAHKYGETATPFILIGEIDRLLRYVISRTVDLDDVRKLCDLDGRRNLRSFDDLTMGDYQRVLENPTTWDSLAWPLHRAAFIKRLAEIREIRNDVMHFNIDGVPQHDVDKLRNMLRLLREYCE